MSTETIAAVATALGSNSISIIRISGNDSINIINEIFKTTHKVEHGKIVYGRVIEPFKNDTIDKVLVSYFKAPKSFTGEDVIEINCHGGRKVTLEVLEIVLKNGARLAKPGEFSKRAFLNGKIDLSQAEAIMDLIGAKTTKQTRIANKQLEGKLSQEINKSLDELLTLMAGIEVNIDYPEYDYEEIENINIIKKLESINNEIEKLENTFEEGKIIKNGINVAIIGKPNVGKSSLLNKLAKSDKAIVTNVAGTTRDVIEETINIDDIILNICDTAGIRKTEDIVEKIGVKRSMETLEMADLVIFMVDSQTHTDSSDLKLLEYIINKKCIIIINKIDVSDEKKISEIEREMRQRITSKDIDILKMSLEKEIGIDELKEKIIEMYNMGNIDTDNTVIITNERHRDLLNKCSEGLIHAIQTVKSGMPIEVITIEIKNAVDCLGEIVGKNISEEVITKIFEKFCLGK